MTDEKKPFRVVRPDEEGIDSCVLLVRAIIAVNLDGFKSIKHHLEALNLQEKVIYYL